jgi:nucleotide-binding universal stress UspA family protein
VTELLVIAVVAWLVIGIVLAVVMGRRGYDAWSWGVVGAILGPLAIPVALSWRPEARSTERVLRAGDARAAGVSVVVGVDGSPESLAATREVVDLLGERLGALTLATVVDFDAAVPSTSAAGSVRVEVAQELLDTAAAEIPAQRPTGVVLAGRPADALLTYVAHHNVDLIAIGARGRGFSKHLLGSVAEQLVRAPDVLVLVAGRVTAPAHAST